MPDGNGNKTGTALAFLDPTGLMFGTIPEAEPVPVTEKKKKPDLTGGWFAPKPGSIYTGKPQYQQGRDYIMSFFENTGRLPTQREYADWKTGQETSTWEYLPDSTMGQMGWGGLTFEDYRQGMREGNIYGPNMPETQVPELWTQPTFEEVSGSPSYELYQAQLGDYIQQQRQQDYQAVNDIQAKINWQQAWYESRITDLNNQIESGDITQEYAEEIAAEVERQALGQIDYYQKQLNALMSPERANQIMAEAEEMIGLGMPFEELPYYTDVSGMKGAGTMNYYQNFVNQAKQAWEQGEYQRLAQEEMALSQGNVQPKQTGNEWSQYVSFVDSLDVAPASVSFMYDKYNEYLNLWLASGSNQDFITWLRGYLGGQL